MSDDRVQIDVTDGVADVRLVRADKMNALDWPMFLALDAVTDELAERDDVRCVVLSGDKPDPDRFDPKPLEGIATGTPTVLVDALIVPIQVKRPLRDGLDAITQVMTTSSEVEIAKPGRELKLPQVELPPFETYDCP